MSNGASAPFGGFFPSTMLPIGFGCAWLDARRGRALSVDLLKFALDCGVTYFDTARMYVSGAAEGILGELCSASRERMVVVSKAGILPAQNTPAIRLGRRALRLVHKLAPHVPTPSAFVPRRAAFDVVSLRQSVETTLRELRTSYLDVLLLHQCEPQHINDELLSLLERFRSEGKVLRYGVATDASPALAISQKWPQLCSVRQIPNSVWQPTLASLPVMPGLVVTHSVLGGRFRQLCRVLHDDADLRARWRARLDLDAADPSTLARLLLLHALHANPDGVVLFSSSSKANIAKNVALARRARDLEMTEQVASLTALLQMHMDQARTGERAS